MTDSLLGLALFVLVPAWVTWPMVFAVAATIQRTKRHALLVTNCTVASVTLALLAIGVHSYLNPSPPG